MGLACDGGRQRCATLEPRPGRCTLTPRRSTIPTRTHDTAAWRRLHTRRPETRAPEGGGAATMSRRLLGLLLGSCLVGSCLGACPAANFDSASDLDLSRFLTGTWYSQQQVCVCFWAARRPAAGRRRPSSKKHHRWGPRHAHTGQMRSLLRQRTYQLSKRAAAGSGFAIAVSSRLFVSANRQPVSASFLDQSASCRVATAALFRSHRSTQSKTCCSASSKSSSECCWAACGVQQQRRGQQAVHSGVRVAST